ncbi:MAG: flagellar hook-basal body complex protein [Burkholderiaceae bacterium]|nr:MAG: flagellar hook-basal body complex protein [Burkholderiaceae bacterium]
MSFYTSLTGLNAATAALSVTSNNIANTGTTGFKRSRADFGDIFATSPLQKASSVIGQGVALKQVSQEFSQGNIQFSANSLDIAITGDGFFPLKSPDGLQDIFTRNGTFLLDDSFAVVNSAGQFLQAATVDSNGKADLENLQKLIIPRSTAGDARETTLVDLALNLPADAEVIQIPFDKDDPATYNLTTAVTVFDAGGNEFLATIFYQKTKRATPDDPTNKFQTHVFIGETKLDELLIQATDAKGEQLYVNKYGEVRSENGQPPIPPEDIARGITKLFNLDDLKNKQDSVPATASGGALSDSLINAWKNAFNIPAKITELLSQINVEESTQFAGVDAGSPIQFTLNIDDSIEPAVIDLSFLNELGADKVKEYTGVEIAREITNQINREYGDLRFFDFSTLKATETSTTADLFKLIANQEDQTPTEDDEIIVTLTEKRTGDDPAKGIFGDFKQITQDDAVVAIQAQVDEQAFSKGLIAANLQVASERLANLDTFTAARSQKSDFQISAGQTSLLGEENTRLQELDLEVVSLAADAAEPTRAERQKITMSELTVSSTNPSAAGTFTIEDSTGVQATVQASDLQAKFGQRTRVELNGVSSDVSIHASANTTTVAGVTSFVSATGALTLTVGSTNYSIDLTGVTAQNSAITTAIVSALQTASVGTSVSTFSVQDSADTITPQREFKISSAGTSFQIQFTRQDETTTVSLTDNLNIFTSGATNLTTIRDYDNNQNAKSTARASIDALVAGGEYEEVGAAKAQQIDFSGILVSAAAGTQVTLSLPTTSENAGGSVSVFASATMTAIDLARQFTDALIENDLAEEVAAFKKTFKDSNDNELRQVVDLGDGKIQIQFETSESTVGDVTLQDSGGNMGTTSTPSVSTDTIFTTREYSASQFGTPTYPDATTAKRQILDNDDGTFTIQFLTEDEDIGPISSTITDDVDITINSAEIQAYQVTKPEIQVLTFTAPANPITTDTGGKKVTLGGVEYTIAPGADGVAIETAADVASFFANVLSDRFDDADISATAAPAGSVVMNFVLDDGDIDLFTIVDTEASGITLTVNQVQDYFNTADLTERDFARQVADSIAPLQVAARVAVENKGDKADVLAAIKAAAATQNIGNAYFSNVETIVAAATSESEKSSATGLSVYLAVLNNGAGLQRAAVEAYSKRDATSTSVLQSIRDAKAVADNEANTLVTLASTQANNANTTLLNVQDFIIDQTGAADINAASAISRENRFLNLKVGYNEVDGGFTFKSAQNDQVSLLSAQEATENELFGLGLQPTSVNEETDLYGSGFYPNGDEIRTNSEQRYGIKVEFDDTSQTFNISSGTTGDDSTVKISDSTPLANLLFGFETQRADIVEAAAVGPTPVVEQSEVPLRGIQSLPAVLEGTSIGINLDNKFAVDPRNDTFVVTIDNVTGLIKMPNKPDYNIEEFRALLEQRINSLADNFGRTVNGVTVEVKTNPVNGTRFFEFTTGTTGDASFLKVSGPSIWGLSDIESAKGSTSEFIEPPQATDDEGFPLFVDRDGLETSNPGDFSEEETRDLFSPIFFDKGELTFDTAGNLSSPLSAIAFKSTTIGDSGATLQFAVNYAGSTQFSNPFSVLAQNQNGRPEGDLIGLDIGDDGLVSANYSNGSQKNLAKVVLANFANPTGLRQIGDASYFATSKSGSTTLGEAGTAGFGTVRAGARERANVDLTQELIELITNQRNFQANAKAIETNNTLTQAIINIR